MNVSGPNYAQMVHRRILKCRRRRGSTSPPLTCVEVNPGPRKVGDRKKKTEQQKRRCRRPKLTDREKGQIEYGLKRGDTLDVIAKAVGCDEHTVAFWRDRLAETGDMKRKPGSGGHNRVLTIRDSKLLELRSRRDRRATAVQLAREFEIDGQPKPSVWTVRRRLIEAGLYGVFYPR
jgi:transposase